MARATVFSSVGTTAASAFMASASTSIAIQQAGKVSANTFPTSKTLKHPVSSITVENTHAVNSMWFRTDTTMPTNGGAAGDVFVKAGATVTVPCGTTAGSVRLCAIGSGAATTYTARLG